MPTSPATTENSTLVSDKPRPVFIISDRTAVTAGTVGQALLSQFPEHRFHRLTIPFVDADDKVKAVIRQIERSHASSGKRPIVFTSFADEDHIRELRESKALVLDVFEPFINRLETHLASESSHEMGHAHGLYEQNEYMDRMDSINFAMRYDDGVHLEAYKRADLILVGVSRAGKTPTSLYLALHYGLLVANYPLADDDFEQNKLPDAIVDNKAKVFGLTIDPLQLHKIREKRRANSQYSNIRQCTQEVQQALTLFKRNRIPVADSTAMSIEEMASLIVHRMGLSANYL